MREKYHVSESPLGTAFLWMLLFGMLWNRWCNVYLWESDLHTLKNPARGQLHHEMSLTVLVLLLRNLSNEGNSCSEMTQEKSDCNMFKNYIKGHTFIVRVYDPSVSLRDKNIIMRRMKFPKLWKHSWALELDDLYYYISWVHNEV